MGGYLERDGAGKNMSTGESTDPGWPRARAKCRTTMQAADAPYHTYIWPALTGGGVGVHYMVILGGGAIVVSARGHLHVLLAPSVRIEAVLRVVR